MTLGFTNLPLHSPSPGPWFRALQLDRKRLRGGWGFGYSAGEGPDKVGRLEKNYYIKKKVNEETKNE